MSQLFFEKRKMALRGKLLVNTIYYTTVKNGLLRLYDILKIKGIYVLKMLNS
ncbi:hypothetical protein FUSO6_12295 [Fusobacterium necrophorum DAB]|nr:hypothetical protein FUSO6_12295 [Fusobacterium necrophorum DAB]